MIMVKTMPDDAATQPVKTRNQWLTGDGAKKAPHPLYIQLGEHCHRCNYSKFYNKGLVRCSIGFLLKLALKYILLRILY